MWQPARLKINGSTKEEKSSHLMAAQSEEGRWATRHGKVSGRLKSFPGQGDQSRAQGEVIYFIPGG